MLRQAWRACSTTGRNVQVRRLSRAHPSTSADPSELDRFQALAADWLNESGPMKPLHAMNKVRVPWIVDEVKQRIPTTSTDPLRPLEGLKLADVGAGAGILSIPLVRLGAHVDGIEPTPECVRLAEHLATRVLDPECAQRAHFVNTAVEDMASQRPESYDVVIASEILEHVVNPAAFVEAVVRLAKPNALLFFTTVNRTLLSKVVGIWLAEGVGLLPAGLHQHEKFVQPAELRKHLLDNDCKPLYQRGLLYDPLLNEWDWFASEQLNYALLARKL